MLTKLSRVTTSSPVGWRGIGKINHKQRGRWGEYETMCCVHQHQGMWPSTCPTDLLILLQLPSLLLVTGVGFQMHCITAAGDQQEQLQLLSSCCKHASSPGSRPFSPSCMSRRCNPSALLSTKFHSTAALTQPAVFQR